jgi:hypothetical protein
MWKAEKIELIKNSESEWKGRYYFDDCYTLKINGAWISNHISKDLKISSPHCFQNCICDFCGEEGCNAGGMLSIVRHKKSLLFIPRFEDMESYLEHDGNADDSDYGDSECPPHEWYESGILEVDEIMLPKFLELLTGFDLQSIPFITDAEMNKVLEWETLVKEKPIGFMRIQKRGNLFLDDIRKPIDASTYAQSRGINPDIYKKHWIILRNYLEFTNWITKYGLPDLISFDHDLGEADEHTGMDCAKWLVNYCLDNKLALPEWAVHSANPAGYDNIKGLLLSFEKNVKR